MGCWKIVDFFAAGPLWVYSLTEPVWVILISIISLNSMFRRNLLIAAFVAFLCAGSLVAADPAGVPSTQPTGLRPLGQAGPGLGIPTTRRSEGDFLPVPDRWRIGLPDDYVQNARSNSIFDPYNQNVLKGDYPIFGQDKFFVLTATSDTLFEARQLPVPSGVSTERPNSLQFFGEGSQQAINQNLILSLELFQGDASFQPKDWSIRATMVSNWDFLFTNELGVVNPNVENGNYREHSFTAMQELFFEKKLADLSDNYDFVSVRAGIQSFVSDFHGFIFSDDDPGVRLFGNADDNRTQFNLAWFAPFDKDTNSGLNTFNTKGQNVIIANIYRQDFLFPGYTAQLSFHGNFDSGRLHYDDNGVLVRPTPIGTIGEKNVNAYYLGWAGDGHIGRFDISHQFYEVLGTESFNEIADQAVNIDAQFAALELAYDEDYARFHIDFVYASGDGNPTGKTASGFDSISDNPDFAGGGNDLFTRQSIILTGLGVPLVNRDSFLPDLRDKEEGQANFVNPGILIYNAGFDLNVTPKVKFIANVSYLQFADPAVLQLVLHDDRITREIGLDYGIGVEYRPFLNNNVILKVGAAALDPGSGFREMYTNQTLYSIYTAATITY
jgi:hypothetical protein